MDLHPHLTHFPENQLALQRELRLRQQIRAARAARRAQRPSRFAALAARLRPALRPAASARLVEECEPV